MAGKRNKRDRNRKTPKSGKNRTPISGHKRLQSQLQPPWVAANIPIHFQPWMDERLPEMLWAVLIVGSVDRDDALSHFRRVIMFVNDHEDKERLHDLTLTGIANLDEPLRNELIKVITEPPWDRALSALLLFDALPAKELWQTHLASHGPDVDLLMRSVGAALSHQSEQATDCKWLRLMAKSVAGAVSFPSNHLPDLLREYPRNFEEVASRMRASEVGLNIGQTLDLTWPRAFWNEAWANFPCIELIQHFSQPSLGKIVTRGDISRVRERLEEHWQQTHSTTAMDPRHDAVFGMAFYCIRILEELMVLGIGNSILGRTGLRTILEVRINLRHLMTEDSPEFWEKWRRYGAGQAKLNALKFDDSIEVPKHIDVQSIEQIASEDIWEEFLTVDLSGWSDLDLRKMSEQVGLKDTYDQHYPWTSGYTHGMWGAIRESCFQTCGNPLHRLHRYPVRRPLPETVEDAAGLVDEILDLVDEAYPGFPHRLGAKAA